MSRLTLTLFGAPCLARDGVALRLRSRKSLALLAYLAVTETSHRRERLAALLWPESDAPRAANSLRYTLSLLRKALDGAWLAVDRDSVGLDGSEKEAVDVVRFRELVRQCRMHGHPAGETCVECLPLLSEAVAHYRGDFMAGFTLRDSPGFDKWQAAEGGALRREVAGALERLAEGYAAHGEVDRGVSYAQRWVALDGLQEAAHRCLMRLYAGSGRRSEALLQYEACAQVLQEELGVGPAVETAALYEAIMAGAELEAAPSVVLEVAAAPHHNLPVQPTPFVGRKLLLEQMADLLGDPGCRLLTVVGPGGIGKTRLAIKCAEEHVEELADGACFVALASLATVDLLSSTILDALDVPRQGDIEPKDQLLRHLRSRSLLLVLDNFEHLAEGASLLTEMLAEAPGLRVLVTSRERLGLRGEWLLPVGGMAYPDEEITDWTEEEYSAIEFFVQCARRVRPDFALASAGASSVARICRLVEGMPLAIELAAPWVRMMDCEGIAREIAREIEGGLDFLATTLRDVPQRHRSMRAVFDHSWGLLSDEEQRVLRQLSVFRGGFRREAGEAVAGASLPLLSALVDRSWVQHSPSDRYEMHELVRQYSAAVLRAEMLEAEAGRGGRTENERVRDRHSRYYGEFLEEKQEPLRGGAQAEAFRDIVDEVANVWAAWAWALERRDVDTIGRFVDTLAYAGRVRRWYHETTQAFDDVAEVLRRQLEVSAAGLGRVDREQTALVLADILSRQALLRSWHGLREQALRLCEESLALLQEVAPSARRDSVSIHTKVYLAGYLADHGDRARGKQLLREALALSEEVGARWDSEYALFHLGMHASHEGDYPEAEGFLERAIAIADETGERAWKAHSLNRLSWVCWAEGEYEKAEVVAEESLRIFRDLEDPAGMAFGFVRLGEIAAALGQYDVGAQQFQKSLAVLEEFGGPILRAETLHGQGMVALALGQHAEAKGLFEKACTIAREMAHPGLLAGALVGLGHAAVALGEVRQASEYFCRALEGAIESEWAYEAISAVMGVASLLAREEDLLRAHEYVTLVLEHPASTQVTKDRAQELLTELACELPAGVFAEAIARGQRRKLEEVAAEILGGCGDAADGD
jgi:predicted ATPase/DNA-binding SARP family transcriptional activator